MKTMLTIGEWKQCVPMITSATGNGWRVLHTAHIQDICYAIDETPLDLIALIGSFSPVEWECAAQKVWKSARAVPMLTCGSDAHAEIFRAFMADVPTHPTPLSALRQMALSKTLTLLEPPGSGYTSSIKTALEYIAARYTEPMTLDDAAQAACYSRCHFCKVFKEQMGMSFVAYLSEFRIKRATDLLLHSERAVTDIAFEVGFNDLSHFERVFRSRRKQTPTQFRQQSKHPLHNGQFLRGSNAQPVLS